MANFATKGMHTLIDIAVAESEFHAVHSQSLPVDIAFLTLFVSYVFFMIANSGAFVNILNHRVKTDSDLVGNTYYVKNGTFIWAKAMLALSLPVVLFPYEKAAVNTPWLMLCLLVIMAVRPLASKTVGFLSGRTEQFCAVRYSSDCQTIILVCAVTPVILVAYCLGTFYGIIWMLLAVHGIYHIIRMIKLLLGIGFSFFDVFLYLCGVEFLPLAVFASVLMRTL